MAIYDALGYAEEPRSKEQTVVTRKHLELSIGVYSRDSLRNLVLAWLITAPCDGSLGRYYDYEFTRCDG